MAGVFDTEVRAAGVPISALIASMCRSAQRVTLADRTALYAQGEPANTLFLILDGFVKTSRICEEGTEITIELLKYGDIAGAIPTRQLGLDGVFGRPACPSPKVEVLRFRLMINVVCVGAATSIRWRSAA